MLLLRLLPLLQRMAMTSMDTTRMVSERTATARGHPAALCKRSSVADHAGCCWSVPTPTVFSLLNLLLLLLLLLQDMTARAMTGTAMTSMATTGMATTGLAMTMQASTRQACSALLRRPARQSHQRSPPSRELLAGVCTELLMWHQVRLLGAEVDKRQGERVHAVCPETLREGGCQ